MPATARNCPLELEAMIGEEMPTIDSFHEIPKLLLRYMLPALPPTAARYCPLELKVTEPISHMPALAAVWDDAMMQWEMMMEMQCETMMEMQWETMMV